MRSTEQHDETAPMAATAVAEALAHDRARLVAALARPTGDLELAEDALHDAVEQALANWTAHGVPNRPSGWLLTAARRRMIDRIRRREVGREKHVAWANAAERDADLGSDLTADAALTAAPAVPDDRLELIFACCHPSLSMEARVALTLKSLTQLTTAEIASAFLVPEPTMAQRLVRAKRKVRDAGVPFAVPAADRLAERLDGVLAVVYLLFNEGYSASSGDSQVRTDLCDEAISLGRVLAELLPDESEVVGLLALMLLHHSRRDARLGASGDVILLEDQDRSTWDTQAIEEGRGLLVEALRRRRVGPYQLQAAISAVHADAAAWADTDWRQIAGLYSVLLSVQDTPVIRLNRLVALSMVDGPDAVLGEVERLGESLGGYAPFHAARADLLRRSGRAPAAASAYLQAAALAGTASERDFFTRKAAQ